MLSHGSISAWIESEGSRLPTYKPTEAWPVRPENEGDYPTISCWVPSELGQTFEICFTDDDLDCSICGYVQIDGQRCGSKFLRAPLDKGKVMRKEGVRTSETEMSLFQFADVVTTDDDDHQGQVLEGMGEIRVVMKAVHISQQLGGGRSRPRSSFPTFERPVIHEKDKKGLMHSVSFMRNHTAGGPQRSKPPLKVVPFNPIVEFVFRYAPIDKLRADGIAPPPEVPSVKVETKNEGSKTDVIDLTLDDDEITLLPPTFGPKEPAFIDLTNDTDASHVPVFQPKTESERDEIPIADDELDTIPVLQIFN
ncbi:hypothetical protein V5O48_008905 [Marasmius crinis-equi]|uniref:DUF7918 domain-containing protein n=1 Tax=Marasmius crinis-equi TaxID=585013 RepID=A0ABR3FD48_9AGAR